MQQLIPEQHPPANPARAHHTIALGLHIARILQHHLRDDALPEAEQGVVLGALGVL
jgi:hypothetical protein